MIRLLLALAAAGAAGGDVRTIMVTPSVADPGVTRFDAPSVALTSPTLPATAPLAVFLTGSYGRPANVQPILKVIAGQGYRVIGLTYNDEPAVLQICARDPEPDCAAHFREMRSFGSGTFPQASNLPAEAIVYRLIAALRQLDRIDPGTGWGAYLAGGVPRWDRIVLSGLSQGAGMAAFIAKRVSVRRVVLFSSPWDFTGADRRPAPWLAQPSATPTDRWYAEYNTRERAVAPLKAAYAALRIPADHVRVFTLGLPPGTPRRGANPYHAITVHDPRYAADWRAMYGRGDASGSQ